MNNRLATSAAALSLLAMAALAGGCSSDKNEGAPDAAIAAPAPDAGPPSDGGVESSNSPFLMLSCQDDDSAGMDAGMEDAGMEDAGMEDAGMEDAGMEDAGMEDAGMEDAGPEDMLTGIDEPCCNPTGLCGTGLACIVGPSEEQLCRPLCDLATLECPYGGVCANFGGTGVCIPASGTGEPCAPELCEADGVCVGATADDAVCQKRCESQDDCDEGTCTSLNGSLSGACL